MYDKAMLSILLKRIIATAARVLALYTLKACQPVSIVCHCKRVEIFNSIFCEKQRIRCSTGMVGYRINQKRGISFLESYSSLLKFRVQASFR
jgi:hypothetical protein